MFLYLISWLPIHVRENLSASPFLIGLFSCERIRDFVDLSLAKPQLFWRSTLVCLQQAYSSSSPYLWRYGLSGFYTVSDGMSGRPSGSSLSKPKPWNRHSSRDAFILSLTGCLISSLIFAIVLQLRWQSSLKTTQSRSHRYFFLQNFSPLFHGYLLKFLIKDRYFSYYISIHNRDLISSRSRLGNRYAPCYQPSRCLRKAR